MRMPPPLPRNHGACASLCEGAWTRYGNELAMYGGRAYKLDLSRRRHLAQLQRQRLADHRCREWSEFAQSNDVIESR
jgi:hypothetical protein